MSDQHVFVITAPDTPETCPECGTPQAAWPLRVVAGEVVLACRSCHVRVGRVVVVGPRVRQPSGGSLA